ncbi:MAG: isoleucine--tRNA ligase [Candidatus Eiseniibacteriota bacterium]|nr:MAG: isoleucine--tRNA ligase [Candidatus Eisenbacteria bacterium]
MFENFSKDLTFSAVEEELIQFWKRERIFEKSVALRADSPRFVFYEGPPTANGLPGVHHVMARTVKDLICRYMTMQGFLVERKAGWDTHGLPVEIEVEQELNLTSKEQIESYGVREFNKRCRESVFRYEKEWRNVTERIGFWLDLDNPYITCTNEYIESVWWILKNFFDKGFIYRAHKILPYCPRCGTALSSHEVSQGYEEVEDPSVYVRFRQKGEPGTSFLVWTTTPWTLISNVALAVHPDEKYARVKVGDEKLVLAAGRLDVLADEYLLEEEFPGRELASMEYEPVFPFFSTTPGAFRVETADFVTMEEGTGIVHIAPAFGEDDYNLGKERNLPVLQPVDEKGHLTEEVTPWADVFVKDADKEIVADLKERGLLYRAEKVVHSYPFCWRCESPLIYYARKSWNIRTTGYRDLMLKCNSEVEWHPRDIGVSRFANWIENNVDWALSRDRYWGTPLNIWICEGCDKETCVGSIEELKNLGAVLPADLDLHKPMVDEFVLKCPECGGAMKRTPEVIDCWFDSGSMPYGQWHYPFENKDKFDRSFPADFISEGMDQSRGWFYSLLAISTFVSGVSCFKSVVPIEMILDKNGQRMSKSKGNSVDPAEILEREGADALRWYLVTVSPPWIPTRFDREGVAEVASKLLATLRNTAQFFVLYANIDGFKPSGAGFERSLMDRWVISRLHSLTRNVRRDMDTYELTRAARAIQEFVIEDLSNWYVRRCRRRFWKAELGPDKLGAYETLYEVLVSVAKLVAPFVPFVSEEIFQKIARGGDSTVPESVHLCNFPSADESLIDDTLEEKMDAVLRVISLGRAARNAAKLKIRQPLSELLVAGSKELSPEALVEFGPLIKEELNVKHVSLVEREQEICEFVGKPRFEALGPRFGKDVGQAAVVVENMTQEELRKIASGEPVRLQVSGTGETLSSTEVQVSRREKPGFAVASEGPWVVAVRTAVTEELRQEGIVREFVHRLQSLRKAANLEVSDRIVLYYEASERLSSTLESFDEYIASEALATGIRKSMPETGAMARWDLEGEGVKVALEKAE